MMILEHVSVGTLSPATPKSAQKSYLEYDVARYHLSRSKSVVEHRPIQRKEKPHIYIHVNPDTYKRDILASVSRNVELNAAHRIFLEKQIEVVSISDVRP
jgi:hypothetical protein